MKARSARLLGLLVVLLAALVLGVGAGAAAGAQPATVTVRAVAAEGRSVLALTQVNTNETPLVKDGEHSCSGTSAAGALELASTGEWAGQWREGFGYGVETIAGVDYPLTGPYRWALWLNDEPVPPGAGSCDVELSPGDSVLFFGECVSEEAGVCAPGSLAPDVLGLEVPAAVEARQPVTVTVLSYPNAGGTPVPAQGATITGAGFGVAPTDARGQTTLVFGGDANYRIQATAPAEGPPAVPAEALVCAHEGDDGTCGTPAPPGPTAAQSPAGGVPSSLPPNAPAASSTGAVSLAETVVTVQGNGTALVKLECLGSASCHGKLTLVAKNAKRKKPRTVTIASAGFSIAGDTARRVRIALHAAGRTLLKAAHGRLTVNLDILQLFSGSKQAQARAVRLIQQRPHRTTRGR